MADAYRILVIGEAPWAAVDACLEVLYREGATPEDTVLLSPRKYLGRFSPTQPVRYFRGTISVGNPGVVATLLRLRPRRAVIVLGDYYSHSNALRLLELYRRLRAPALGIEFFRCGVIVPLSTVEAESVGPGKSDALPNGERTLVIGSAPRDVVAASFSTLKVNNPVYLVNEREKTFFIGTGLPIWYFRRLISWVNPDCAQAIRVIRPTRAVILVGVTYDHENVIRCLLIHSQFLHLELKIDVLQNGELRPYDTPQASYCIPAIVVLTALGALGALLIRALHPMYPIRVASVWATRLGHFTMDSELYLCRKELGIEPKSHDIFYYKPNTVCNKTIARMYQREMFVHSFLRYVDEMLGVLPGCERCRFRFNLGISRDPDCLFQKTAPHIAFTEADTRDGEVSMRVGGIDPDLPLVLISGRDNVYLDTTYPEKDFFLHQNDDNQASSCRNMDIRTFEPAVRELLGYGYQVARVGSQVERALQIDHPHFTEYSTNGMRSDFLDIFMPSRCTFFLGSASGILAVPMVFRRPCAYVNLIRLEHIHTWDPRELTIFKRVWLVREKRFMTLSEYMAAKAGDWPLSRYLDPDIELVDNTAGQILDLAEEMHRRLNGSWETTEEDEALQRRFWSFFPISPLNHCFNSRIGTRFLRECRELLD